MSNYKVDILVKHELLKRYVITTSDVYEAIAIARGRAEDEEGLVRGMYGVLARPDTVIPKADTDWIKC